MIELAHLLDIGLENIHHLPLHLGGSGPWPLGGDDSRLDGKIWILELTELAVADGSADDKHCDDENRQTVEFDRGPCEIHSLCALRGELSRTFTSMPSLSAPTPAVTTRSPSEIPLRMGTWAPVTSPI